ncbi:3-(3-hydroxy-phenyl)propionate transporter MhpT [Acinetobacter venetianus]|uniref:3-(3-hydroxy-phenyl)propionate transporter MhpT n=1 Tax=Acinetobacter TaxID=469 RepID=UPI0007757676|nr:MULTISPECIES: 3-(3-hydroxy-phenyl)propionate transporter MhpT [Acinetobacter]KXO87402.1 3-(3-hydroxy-phenyl)propionate transporter MhpT [Acinetobacter venetianus]MBJ8428806.1 3-(3-hydroxy-phenyl)propionate transporter MhpT [Acinetobacter pittii]
MKTNTLNFTIGICFIIALIEGIDIQAIGVAASSIKNYFELDSAQLGLLFSIGIFGLLPGTLIGGYYADKIGRKKVLIGAVGLFAIFTLSIVFVTSFTGLLIVRFLAGLGFGAALPNLIALASESVPIESKGKAVGMMYCGMPIGAILISLWAALDSSDNWKLIFYIGGIVPLVVIPFMFRYLPESKEYTSVHNKTEKLSYLVALFGKDQKVKTLLLWVGCFFTAMVLYIMLSWLPSLFVELGFTKQQGSMAQVFFQTGATIGTLLFTGLIDKQNKTLVISIVYFGILIGLILMNISSTLIIMYISAAFTGFFIIGSNGVSYAFSSFVYPTENRGQGVGASNAIGRIGAMLGPVIAGQILQVGLGTSGVLISMIPFIIVALTCMFILAKIIQKEIVVTSQ